MKDSKDNKKNTRSNKYDKERKTIKLLTFAVIIAALFVVVLLVISLFNGGDEPQQEVSTESSSIIINDDEGSTQSESQSSQSSSESESSESESSESEESEESESVDTEEIDPSDENVTEAYTGDWEPVETEQEGEHTTNFSDGSQDRIEIKKAAAIATGLNESDMIEWWVENGGEGQVVATVSDSAQTTTYRVYLGWVDNQGWQPTKVEQLKENDKR